MRQQTLAAQTGFEKYGRKTKRERFLEEMEQVVPWAELEALVEPHYPKGENGRPPVGLSIMLRVYFLQQWFNLSDPGAEDALYESPVLRHFVGIDLGRAPVPEESKVWGDGGYQGQGEAIRQAAARAQDMTSRRVRYKDFVDELQKVKNRVKARVRAKVEHPFRILKCIFGFEKVRYRGIKKNHHRLCASFALVNLYLHRRRLAVARA